MNAADVVAAIGKGLVAALETNERFLGADGSIYRNAQIQTEYVTTVKLGEALVGFDRVVRLEASMRGLRRKFGGLARLHALNDTASRWPAIESALAPFTFGKQRLDVLVESSDTDKPPLLMVEAKLGVSNVAGVIRDIDRIVKLFEILEAVGMLQEQTYGAAVFHVQQDGARASALQAKAQSLLDAVAAHVAPMRTSHPRLKIKAGLLTGSQIEQPVSGSYEIRDDGAIESEFEKDGFAFSAGMVLIGACADIDTVQF